MNATSCVSDVPPERLHEPGTLATFLVLGLINVLVIFGNLLVMVAVLASTKLRTVTNYFVVSLAVADLSVGIIVLPYSIVLEVLEVWIFGHTWCQIWLAVDVWLCTSSILNLCAISVDRYLAITRPVRYRSLMSSRRTKLLIVAVWVTAFVICFPPLVGWNDGTQNNSVPYRGSNETRPNGSSVVVDGTALPLCESAQCVLINNKGYVIYSALGSFYIPMLFMLFFNYRIYRAAIQTGRALERGFITTKSGKIKGRTQDQRLTLRVHRGNDSALNVKRGSEHVGAETCIDGIVTGRRRPGLKKSRDEPSASARSANKARQQSEQRATRSAPPSFKSNRGSGRNSGRNGTSASASAGGSKGSRSSKRSQRWQAKRFRTEAKATKTVGTIVGGFICCWLPFFTVYLVRAFCEHCIPNLLFSVFFWLGYCNSALNPLIYALVSKDFRLAFKRILCRCRLKEGGVSSLIKQIHMLTVLDDPPPENAESP